MKSSLFLLPALALYSGSLLADESCRTAATLRRTDSDPAPRPATLKSLTATGDYGKGEDIAQAVVFLASANASYITGAALTVDGGANA
ncbi:SDR family oxidoreductase [Caballeronia temeraria]|uniref:SDR family oxidoreductase n=1 Tax=Caballeronia temeraria TaxID=1777137 RepID=UPI0031338E1D